VPEATGIKQKSPPKAVVQSRLGQFSMENPGHFWVEINTRTLWVIHATHPS
jgi:hypothetical protein